MNPKISPVAEWGSLGILVFLALTGMPMIFWAVRAFVGSGRTLAAAIERNTNVLQALEVRIVTLEGAAETNAVERAAEHEQNALRRHAEIASLVTSQASITRRHVMPRAPLPSQPGEK